MNKAKKSQLLPLFFTVFIDMVGLGIVIPILAPLLLDFSNNILPQATPLHIRTIILGFLMAAYPLAQFVGAPILGSLADRYGRKKILILSLVGTFIGYLIFGLGIILGNIYLIFFSRILDGFTGGNISVAIAAISDLSKNEKEKARNFGFIGMAFGLGFIVGPYIGGKLADPNLVSWFNFATPFWFAAGLSVINIALISLRFKETIKEKIVSKIHYLAGFSDIKTAFTSNNLRNIFIVIFVYTFALNFFTNFFQVFLLHKFSFTQSQIGELFSYLGLWIAFTQGALVRPLTHFLKPKQIFFWGLLLLSLAFPFLLIPDKAIYLYLILPFIAIINGLIIPIQTTLVSEFAGEESQGGILGINQSVQSLAIAIPPIIAGFAVSVHISLPIILASVFSFVAAIFFLLFFRENNFLQKLRS